MALYPTSQGHSLTRLLQGAAVGAGTHVSDLWSLTGTLLAIAVATASTPAVAPASSRPTVTTLLRS